ncbi:hypothetical protein [Sebaldella sp. S0638]|uniref:hypothetical protein n=1 Tax=Sebaldella sp. S0638 TaxID=2957809 RepID=UPI00209D79B0|nr:hypothetical protein [Sebaldella sp. S0638]MCP1223074.1 hypothetical protein [Sebaldella sp. S0638]
MKKTLIPVIFLLFSLMLLGNYTVTQGTSVKLSEKELKANNTEIENRVKTVFDINSYSPEELRSIIWREYPDLTSSPSEEADVFINYIKSVFSNTKYEIKSINYTDSNTAKVILSVSIPNPDELSSDAKQAEIEKTVEKKFTEKTGVTYSTLEKDKNLMKKYEPLLLRLYMETSTEEIKNIKTYNKEESVYTMKKSGNVWNFKNNAVNFFGN